MEQKKTLPIGILSIIWSNDLTEQYSFQIFIIPQDFFKLSANTQFFICVVFTNHIDDKPLNP